MDEGWLGGLVNGWVMSGWISEWMRDGWVD